MGNYAFIDDVALGHALAMERGTAGERYILGGENINYNALFKIVAEVSVRQFRLLHVPPSIVLGASHAEEMRARLFRGYPSITPGWAKTFLADNAYSCEKAIRELSYRFTPLKDGLRTTVRWLRETELEKQKRKRNLHHESALT